MDAWKKVKEMEIGELIDWTMSSESTLRLAAKNEIANRQFVCVPCRKEFKYRCLYKYHLKSRTHIYTIEPPDWRCKECNKTFLYKSRYERHMNSHKNKILKPNLICEKCNFKATCKSQYQIHITTKKHLRSV